MARGRLATLDPTAQGFPATESSYGSSGPSGFGNGTMQEKARGAQAPAQAPAGTSPSPVDRGEYLSGRAEQWSCRVWRYLACHIKFFYTHSRLFCFALRVFYTQPRCDGWPDALIGQLGESACCCSGWDAESPDASARCGSISSTCGGALGG